MITQDAGDHSLTGEAVLGSRRAQYDLATGYPALVLPDSLIACVAEGTDRALRTNWSRATVEAHRLALELDSVVRALLGIGSESASEVFTTFSGSVSIERVFAATLQAATASGSDGVDLILLEPCVDIFRLMVAHSRSFRVIPVVSVDPEESIRLLAEAIQKSASNRVRRIAVCIESPRNPLGTYLSEHQLGELAAVCGAVGALLIIDQCFLVSGVQNAGSVPAIFGSGDLPCQWIALWDTGKTIDLNGDKLGFIITGSREVAASMQSAVAAIQGGTALRPLSVFARLLSHEALPTYLDRVRVACRANLEHLVAVLPSGWSATRPDAGSFSCLTWHGSEPDPVVVRDVFLAVGVSTVTSRPFFSAAPPPGGAFIRIALAREEEQFAAASDKIAGALQDALSRY